MPCALRSPVQATCKTTCAPSPPRPACIPPGRRRPCNSRDVGMTRAHESALSRVVSHRPRAPYPRVTSVVAARRLAPIAAAARGGRRVDLSHAPRAQRRSYSDPPSAASAAVRPAISRTAPNQPRTDLFVRLGSHAGGCSAACVRVMCVMLAFTYVQT
jgi:hypothetical protein